MNEEVFSNLKFVGGTSFVSQIGNRQSIDIKIFEKISWEQIKKKILLELNSHIKLS